MGIEEANKKLVEVGCAELARYAQFYSAALTLEQAPLIKEARNRLIYAFGQNQLEEAESSVIGGGNTEYVPEFVRELYEGLREIENKVFSGNPTLLKALEDE